MGEAQVAPGVDVSDLPYVQDPQNMLLTSEPAQLAATQAHTAAKVTVSSKVLCWQGYPIKIGFSKLALKSIH